MMRYAFATVVVLLASVCANAQPQKARHAALAARFTAAPDAKKFIESAWQCPKGVCPTHALAKELKQLRVKALDQCAKTWPLDPDKGNRCKKAVELMPKNFTFKGVSTHISVAGASQRAGPETETREKIYVCPDDTQVSKPEDCLVTPLKAVLYVCQDGRETASLNDCVVKATNLWWRILLFLLSVIIAAGVLSCFGILMNRYRNKWIDEMALTAQLRQEVEKKGSISMELQKKLETMPTVSTTPLPAPPTGSQPTPTPLPAPPADAPAETPKKEGTLLGIGGPESPQLADSLTAPAKETTPEADVSKGTILGIGPATPATELPGEPPVLYTGDLPAKGQTHFHAGEAPPPESPADAPMPETDMPKGTILGMKAPTVPPTTPAEKPGDNSK